MERISLNKDSEGVLDMCLYRKNSFQFLARRRAKVDHHCASGTMKGGVALV